MKKRKVSETDIVAVLEAPIMTWHDPTEDSMVLTGRGENGRDLLVWVAGSAWPVSGTIRVKSTSWKDEDE